jgi:hypothetical protein
MGILIDTEGRHTINQKIRYTFWAFIFKNTKNVYRFF